MSNCSALTANEVAITTSLRQDYWYFISPMVDVNIADIAHSDASASFVFRYYNGEKRASNGSGGWNDLTDNILHAGQGYIFRTNRSGTVTFKAHDAEAIAQMTANGDFVTELQEFPSESDVHAGWNYIANPYPCYFDASYIDYTAPITVWDSSRSTYQAVSLIDDAYVLRPLQAFFVQRPQGISSLTFLKEGRQTSSSAIAHVRAREKKYDREICNILISGNNSSDATRVVVNPEAHLGYEISRDAAKFSSHESSVPQIASIDAEGNLLAINERPQGEGIVALSVYFPAQGTYNIDVDNERFMLLDVENGVIANSHTVTVDSNCTIDNRFSLTLPTPAGVTDSKTGVNNWNLKVNDCSVTIKSECDTKISIVGVDGRIVYICNAKANAPTSINLERGAYIALSDGKAVKFIVK